MQEEFLNWGKATGWEKAKNVRNPKKCEFALTTSDQVKGLAGKESEWSGGCGSATLYHPTCQHSLSVNRNLSTQETPGKNEQETKGIA